MEKITALEPDHRFIPIRAQYFSNAFWTAWRNLSPSDREVYLLGWLAKLENMMKSTIVDKEVNANEADHN